MKILQTEQQKKVKEIKIYRSKYKIYSCKKILVNKIKYLGFIDYSRKDIFIKDKYFKDTLQHEITHAIFFEVYKKAKRNKRMFKKLKSNEGFIDFFSKILEQIFILK
jgi:hypothetical protein